MRQMIKPMAAVPAKRYAIISKPNIEPVRPASFCGGTIFSAATADFGDSGRSTFATTDGFVSIGIFSILGVCVICVACSGTGDTITVCGIGTGFEGTGASILATDGAGAAGGSTLGATGCSILGATG